MQYVLRLIVYFYPQEHQVTFAWRLWMLILSGYKRRNPLRRSATEEFAEMCRSIAAGEPMPDDSAGFLDASWCATLIGTPGTGKSATSKGVLRRLFPDLIHHIEYGVYQLGYIVVEAPKHSTGKTLAQLVFQELLAKASKTGHPVPYLQREPKTEVQLLHAVRVLADRLNLGLLVLEEVQHLYAGTGRMDAQAMKFLTGVVNTMRIPILFVGVWECLALLESELRIGRRGTTFASARFKRMQDASPDWTDFLDGLEEIQFVLKPKRLDESLRPRLYFHTQGVHDVVVKLWVLVQLEAISSGVEELSVELVDAVAAEHMDLIAPACKQMREGTLETMIGLWDAEPTDFARYVERFIASRGVRKTKPVRNDASRNSHGDGVCDQPPPASADTSASASAKRPKRLPASRTEKTMAAAEPGFIALDERDVRRVTFLAVRNGVSPEKALEDAGYVCLLADELAA
jgi:hypothetical protein